MHLLDCQQEAPVNTVYSHRDSATAMQTGLGTIQFWFNYSRGILAFTFPGSLTKEMPR